ncbi:MAG: M23 family metallopeptidase [Chloroflexota bacterium]|jgi:murein DD-endopeptidase MepM/ murein hydrolase activator NlpD
MPALGSPRHGGHLRLVGVGLALLFLATIGSTWATPVEARDWTPQIKATRKAQLYWESVMRAADKEVRSYKKAQRQARRKLRRTSDRAERTVERRARAKRKLALARQRLVGARYALAATNVVPPPPPDVSLAVMALSSSDDGSRPSPVGPGYASPSVDQTGEQSDDTVLPGWGPVVSVSDVKRLEHQLKQQKRELRKAKRKARRAARQVRQARNRVAAAKAGRRGAVARREQAERSLGAWILAMEKYGRTRARKKSDARPGINSSFAWPARGRITQYYGRDHDGIDIASYRGAPIRAAAFGVVSYIGWNPWDEHGRAFMVVVAHASGFETLYGHVLPRRSVRVGQEVKKGEVIGYMGNTGFSTGTHLHFELRRGRTTLNPLGYL